MNSGRSSPSVQLLGHLADELRRHAPFAQMAPADVQAFLEAARQTYYAPGETILQPADGPVRRLLYVRRGAVNARHGVAELSQGGIHLTQGDIFPADAVVAQRPVSATYEAQEDCFCLEVDAEMARDLARRSPIWADFLVQRVQQLLELSRRALQAEQGAHALAEQALEAPLSQLPRKTPVACGSDTPLVEALQLMLDRRVGSVLVLDDSGKAAGILTQHDVLKRVALWRPPDGALVASVMSSPVHTLDITSTAQDAALAMLRHGVRHLPLTENGRVVSIVSERDLFALQRQSLGHIGSAIRAASGRADLATAAGEIRGLARQLMAQGLSARALTELISHLNDRLTERLVQITAAAHGLDMAQACWLVFGSEARSEQTIATDQDNGLVFVSEKPELDRPKWLAMALEVNRALDACGYPLCKGQVMASNPECCLTPEEWTLRFARWMEQGAPKDLLKASIYFDLRALCGNTELVPALQEFVSRRAQELPRFRKQLADNAMGLRPALNWRGAIDAQHEGRAAWVDLKLGGTMVFVDAARLFALAHGVMATGTRQRLQEAGAAMKVPATEIESWVSAFEVLQMLRLRQQVGPEADPDHPNRIDEHKLGAIDRRLLKEALQVARMLQQRLELDYAQ